MKFEIINKEQTEKPEPTLKVWLGVDENGLYLRASDGLIIKTLIQITPEGQLRRLRGLSPLSGIQYDVCDRIRDIT